ncbi:phosphoenolpyruvate carboxykinase (ATP) [bacterium]|nr:phosphoenolpyruvate carboxykinase (ATP) [bacterium]
MPATAKLNINLSTNQLADIAVAKGEAKRTKTGALACFTGEHTGRSPKDKFTVKDATTEKTVDWGTVNQPMSEEHFNRLRQDQLKYLADKELYVSDAYAGADKDHRLGVRVINERAWHNIFCRHLFLRPQASELGTIDPDFTIIHTPWFKANPAVHGTNSETFIAVNFTQGLILIGGTQYAGEQKKSIFSVLNYLYPLKGIFSMHCSANVSKTDKNDVALFFGLSGTGKTTLSADPNRRLIGDDEHGWSEKGVFNFEGGCYAKCINLTEEREPEIFRAIRDNAILENVVLDAAGVPNYDDKSLTENTRAAYPINYINDAVLEGTGTHPKHIVFLTCDAFGVMPPISKLTPDQAMYHFLSGYTAKVAGTEKGMGNTPQTTFSTCFGAPFLPLKPTAYAELLGKKIKEHNAQCWLVNTGWTGGGVGVGSRMKLNYTRRMVQAALCGELDNVSFVTDEIFGLQIPTTVPDVPREVLTPKNTWKNTADYERMAKELAQKFRKNFERFSSYAPNLVAAGPKA